MSLSPESCLIFLCRGDDGKVSTCKEQKLNSPNHFKSKKRKEMLEGGLEKLHDKLRTSGGHSDVRLNDGGHHHGYQAKEGSHSSKVHKSQHVLKGKKLSKDNYWLTSDLRVKMVDRTYKKGRHYNTKVCKEWHVFLTGYLSNYNYRLKLWMLSVWIHVCVKLKMAGCLKVRQLTV